MISTSISLSDGDKDYRDIIGFYFAKWFDEPFTVDVLNRTHFRNLSFKLTSTQNDRLHRDYEFVGLDNKIHYVDSKTHYHNFEYDKSKVAARAADVITIGEYALNSKTEFISFVYRQKIYFIHHLSINSITPIHTQVSKGQNNKQQTLSHYSVESLINLPTTYYTEIPTLMWECYEEAYKLYLYYKNDVFIHSSPKKKDTSSNIEYNFKSAEAMRTNLIPIIEKFNKIYDELPKEDENTVLTDIYSLLS